MDNTSKENYAQADNKSNRNSATLKLLDQIMPLARGINCLDIETVVDVCLTKMPEILGATYASLYVLDDTANMLHLQKCSHPYTINALVSINQNPPSPMVLAVRSKELIIVSDIAKHTTPVMKPSQRTYSGNYQTTNCAIAPLVCQDRVVGVLNLSDKITAGEFTKEDIALLELFRQLIGASIGNIKLFEKAQWHASTDGLTGLVNHRNFYETLEKELWRSRRYGGKIAVIMADMDYLKRVNDVFGHRAGDKAIKEVSRHIKASIRQIDTAARYGGDEFAIILPNTSLKNARTIAERIVQSIAECPMKWKGQTVPLSVSVGLGQYDCDSNPEDITSRSDEALYRAKHSGKNTVEISN